MSLPSYLSREGTGAFLLRLWVQPRASRSEFADLRGDQLKIRLAAPPVDGQANRELIRFLAKALGMARGDVTLVAGQSSRAKTVRVENIAEHDLLARLPGN